MLYHSCNSITKPKIDCFKIKNISNMITYILPSGTYKGFKSSLNLSIFKIEIDKNYPPPTIVTISILSLLATKI